MKNQNSVFFKIEEEAGHPGRHLVRLIGTPAAVGKWIDEMTVQLAVPHAWDDSCDKNERCERLLLRIEANSTKPHPQRVTVAFYEAINLDYHHVRPSKSAEFFDRHGCLLFWPILILAIVGMLALQSGFRPW